MAAPQRTDAERARVRTACVVVIVAMVAWMGLSALGGAMGLPPRFAFLIDLAAIAAFIWALFVLVRVWRAGASR